MVSKDETSARNAGNTDLLASARGRCQRTEMACLVMFRPRNGKSDMLVVLFSP